MSVYTNYKCPVCEEVFPEAGGHACKGVIGKTLREQVVGLVRDEFARVAELEAEAMRKLGIAPGTNSTRCVECGFETHQYGHMHWCSFYKPQAFAPPPVPGPVVVMSEINLLKGELAETRGVNCSLLKKLANLEKQRDTERADRRVWAERSSAEIKSLRKELLEITQDREYLKKQIDEWRQQRNDLQDVLDTERKAYREMHDRHLNQIAINEQLQARMESIRANSDFFLDVSNEPAQLKAANDALDAIAKHFAPSGGLWAGSFIPVVLAGISKTLKTTGRLKS